MLERQQVIVIADPKISVALGYLISCTADTSLLSFFLSSPIFLYVVSNG